MHPEISLVIDCCLDLHEQGKKPSVALVKARLGKQVSLPAIITGLTKWPSTPKKLKNTSLKKNKIDKISTKELSVEERLMKLEKKVSQLEAHIEKLQSI